MNGKLAKTLRRAAKLPYGIDADSSRELRRLALRMHKYHYVQCSDSMPRKTGMTLVLDTSPRKWYNYLKREVNLSRRDVCSSHSVLSRALPVTESTPKESE